MAELEQQDPFGFLDGDFLKRSEIYPGSVGTFRYRFQRSGKMGDGQVQAWVYENICFEKARHVETETFPWTQSSAACPAGMAEREAPGAGSGPYRVWDRNEPPA